MQSQVTQQGKDRRGDTAQLFRTVTTVNQLTSSLSCINQFRFLSLLLLTATLPVPPPHAMASLLCGHTARWCSSYYVVPGA